MQAGCNDYQPGTAASTGYLGIGRFLMNAHTSQPETQYVACFANMLNKYDAIVRPNQEQVFTCLSQILDKLCQRVPFGGVHVNVVLVGNELVVYVLCSNSCARVRSAHQFQKVAFKFL